MGRKTIVRQGFPVGQQVAAQAGSAFVAGRCAMVKVSPTLGVTVPDLVMVMVLVEAQPEVRMPVLLVVVSAVAVPANEPKA